MASDRQIEANRRNAQRSTGPRSPEGRARSSRNAMRHGVLSQHVVATESEQDLYEDLLQELNDDFIPVTRTEKVLVERLAVLFLRERRLAQSERYIMRSQQNTDGNVLAEIELQRAGGPPPLKLSDHFLVGRYQTMLTNQISQTLRELRALQACRTITNEPD